MKCTMNKLTTIKSNKDLCSLGLILQLIVGDNHG